jgi:hypothetical protein
MADRLGLFTLFVNQVETTVRGDNAVVAAARRGQPSGRLRQG